MQGIQTIVGFGASSMQGACDSCGGFFKRTQGRFAGSHPRLGFTNLGIGGDTTREMLARCAAAESIAHRGVVVMLGCNDLPRDDDGNPTRRTMLEEYEANLVAVLGQIRGERSLFISSFPVCASRTKVRRTTFSGYMGAALSVARRCGYEIWDLHGELLDADLSPYWADDGLHFKDTGHEFIAQGLTRRLLQWVP